MNDFENLPEHSVGEIRKALDQVDEYIDNLSTIREALLEELNFVYDIVSSNEDDIEEYNIEITDSDNKIKKLKKENKELKSEYNSIMPWYYEEFDEEDDEEDYDDDPGWMLDSIDQNNEEIVECKQLIKNNKAKIIRRQKGIIRAETKISPVAANAYKLKGYLYKTLKSYFSRNK